MCGVLCLCAPQLYIPSILKLISGRVVSKEWKPTSGRQHCVLLFLNINLIRQDIQIVIGKSGWGGGGGGGLEEERPFQAD